MEAGVVTSRSKRYDATQPLAIAGFHIRDDHPMKRWLNVPETLVHRSNIATARIADEMGTGPMQAIFRQLEFDRRPPIELKERASPRWPPNWGHLQHMTVSYGHALPCTPPHPARPHPT